MASTKLSRTQGTPTENKKFTVSCWFKAAQVANEMKLIYADDNSTNNYTYIHFSDTSGRIRFQNRNGGSNNTELIWENYIRDFSSFYHLVMAVDSTQATASDRVKFYLNGVQQTTLDSSANTFPPQNQTFTLNDGGYDVEIGASNSSSYFNGVMSQFIFVDGTQYAASTFGSTNTVSGEWKPNANPTVTYGTNGFKLTFEDTSALGDDTSGNTNDFTMSGSGTSTLDCPSNNFSVLNALYRPNGSLTYANGMTTVGGDGGPRFYNATTLGANSGKIYCEAKINNINAGAAIQLGITANPQENNRSNTEPGANTYSYALRQTDGEIIYNSSGTSYGTSYTTNDIIGIAMDLDNNKLYFSKNGVWMNSANPSGSTGGFSITDVDTISNTNGFYHFAVGDDSGSQGGNNNISFNFGNGFFGTTAVSSAGTGASTPGTFEYDVPTNYQPLTTKGLNV